ncbi:beta-ketoacyl synthase N-terminal-like domain-containing protein [Streptomyces sp. MA15]|uniref:beta-ketoacyl synthase N-terminal-like domain-containing protein n=1 Tax=Streptomyces sp. MA15 TaxID=3055061 RepID=UPI0025B0B456|nr:beta-ketoacyl synthase N-terminal-like domain-containing protein [Streptomyces sp. MA15]MDN3270107.1 beta-ketoacyl synthase N-terminal-like domain-containing protein [Streptomyces sp. MA15]
MAPDAPRIAAAAVRLVERDFPRVPRETADVPRMPLAVRDVLGPELLATAREALTAAGVTDDDTHTLGCVTASHRATSATSAYIAEVLDSHGPRWLAPECFLHYSAHSLTGRLCIELGLDGAAVTLTGPSSGIDALGYAASVIASGRLHRVLVAAAYWPPPGTRRDTGTVPLRTAAVVLTGAGGWGDVTGWRPGGGHPAVGGADDADHERSDPSEAFAALADWYRRRPGVPTELLGGGSRLVLRPGGAV